MSTGLFFEIGATDRGLQKTTGSIRQIFGQDKIFWGLSLQHRAAELSDTQSDEWAQQYAQSITVAKKQCDLEIRSTYLKQWAI